MGMWRDERVQRAAVVVLVAILALAFASTIHQKCVDYLNDWTSKSVGTVVVAGGISSGLSVIEDSEVQVSFLGTGASIALGDSVRPLNDMLGRVVVVALASAVSLGIQRVLVDLGASNGFKLLLLVAVFCQLVAVWIDRPILRQFANGLLAIALVATLAVPGAVLLTGSIGDHFTENTYSTAQQQMDELETEVSQFNPRKISELGDRLKSTAAAYSEFAITYIVIFIVQTILMPILILWGLVKIIGRLLSPDSAAQTEARLIAAIREIKETRDEPLMASESAADGTSA